MDVLKAWTIGLVNGRCGWSGHVPAYDGGLSEQEEFTLPELPEGWQWSWGTDSRKRNKPARKVGYLRHGKAFHFRITAPAEIAQDPERIDPLQIIETTVVDFLKGLYEGKKQAI
jgi:hypothetical protein